MPKRYAPKPKTTDTYAQTRYNSVQHGALSRLSVLPWENAQDLEEIRINFFEEYQPKETTETYLVLELANIVFRKQRLYQAENALVVKNLAGVPTYHLSGEAKLLSQEGFKGQVTVHSALYPDLVADQNEIRTCEESIGWAQKAIQSNLSYEKLLQQCGPVLIESWKEWLEDEEAGYVPTKESFIQFLKENVIDYYQDERATIKTKPYAKQQAIGSAYIPNDKTETLQRYETGLDRKFERTLCMLLKLQEVRKAQGTIISANTG